MWVDQPGQQAGGTPFQKLKEEQCGAEAVVERQACWTGVGKPMSGKLARVEFVESKPKMSLLLEHILKRCSTAPLHAVSETLQGVLVSKDVSTAPVTE